MGVGRRKLALLWALGLTLACAQHTGQAQDSTAELGYAYPDLPPAPQGPGGNSLRGVTIHPPLRSTPLVRALNAAHRGRVCSTWGDFHYKTFDGDVFRFPGLCNYVFSAHCGAAYEDFNLQLRRGPGPNATAPSRVTMKLDGMVVELTKGSVLVNSLPIQLPFSRSGVLIEQRSSGVKVAARLGLVFMWNQDDSLLLELDPKYANQTCGLCGDFNGVPVFNEFFSHNIKLTATEFGNLQKMDGPTEQCQDPAPEPPVNCLTGFGICEEMLSSEPFLDCAALVDASSYVEACRQDLCHCGQANLTSCLCHTLAEYSRQCTHAGGLPLDWRGPQLCPQTCPLNMQYRECGSPCVDTCSNLEHSQLCEDHCVAGCFCPEGTVLDDVGHTGCIPVPQCSCVYNGATYTPGTGYSTDCTNCTCAGGRWRCQEVQCPGTCSVLGGAHFSTFDERQYTVHGDCSYVLAKPCDSSAFTVLAELRRCGLTDSETCLKSLTLTLGGGHMVFVVKASGAVFMNQIYTQLPLSAANVTLFRPSTFFIIAQTQLGLQLDIQLVPVMQVFVRLAPQLQGQTCGLCGNFNQNQADDFRTISGVVEGTAAAFANTWKTQAACPNVKNSLEDPCSLSVENEKYAQHWCSRLTDPRGPFTRCHAAVSPSAYYSNCMFDTCNCEKSEDCMCAALSSYVRACAARGVLLGGWRDGMCTKAMTTCPQSLTYLYNISTCQPTCRARSDADVTCSISFVPVDGCTCPDGTFLDDTDQCVPATSCPCYHGGSVVPNGESTHEQGVVCTCTQGTLTCIGGHAPAPVCTPPMVYFDCHNTTPGATGAGCQKSCHTLDMDCYSSQCVPGCVCPHGLVATGDGGCIPVSDCPCVHNEASYKPGQVIRVGCRTCTCKSRMWQCTDQPCPATCAVYGDGHYRTFDGQRYSFSGGCEYTLLQDHCGGDGSAQDGFHVITENVPCGTTGATCSKAIKIFLGSYELKLSDGNMEVIEKEQGQLPPFSIRQMGNYLVVDTDVSLVLLWDKGTSIFLTLSPEFKGRVCGLCGNFDDNALNDFTTRSQSVVGDVLEFGNSWKFSPSCPDAQAPKDPCTANPYRKSWAQKQCSIINSATFSACHAHVESARYYEACVSDACACDSGGDCECLCTAVAAYAQACRDAGVCVSWRTPDICPLFCDYYNPKGHCEWHYQPCGAPYLRTCRNPRGQYLHDVRGLEGCYPKCPSEAPIFDEDQMRCVASCPTPTPPLPCRVQGKSYRPGSVVPSEKNCHHCVCTESGVQCTYHSEACVCTYDGRRFRPREVIYHTTDGTGGCIFAHCGANGTIERRVEDCNTTTPTPQTTFAFSTPIVVSSTLPPSTHPSPSEKTAHAPSSAPATTPGTSPGPTPPTASAPPSSRPRCGEECQWSPWLDVSRPGWGIDSGDFDTLENLRAYGYRVCRAPRAVECRAENHPDVGIQTLGQVVQCSLEVGLVCRNRDQKGKFRMCLNYEVRVLCCEPQKGCPCETSTTTVETTSPTTAHRTSTTTVETTSPTTAPTTSTTTVETTGPTTAPTTSTTTVETTSPTTARRTSTTTVETTSPTTAPTTSTTFVSVPETTHSQPWTTSCQPQCTWTKWFDEDFPSPGPHGGDFETYSNIVRRGEKICRQPEYISALECRAENHPDVGIQTLGQVVQCSPEVGLVCRNRDQKGKFRMCLNYEVRVLCCEPQKGCPVTHVTTTGPTTAPTTSTTTVETTGPTTAPTTSTTTVETMGPTTAPTTSTTFVSIPETTHSQPWTTSCQPQCTWTKWFDADFPSPGPHGGDFETYSNIVRRGEKICRQPEYISALECRAENHPDVGIQTLGQVVQCSPEVGLVCRNRDQKGKFRMCLNYEVRVLCCEPQKGCPVTHVTVSSTSSVSVTSQTGTTFHEATSSATTVQTTSSTTAPTTSTTTVETTGPTTAPTTSTSTVEITSPTTAPTTSTTTVETTSPTTAPTTSTTTVETTGPTTAPTTSTTTPSLSPESTTPTVSLVTSPSSAAPSTSTCYCSVASRLYSAGSIIYQQTDLSGHCYYALCSLHCHVVRRTDHTCPTSTPPPAPATSTPVSSPSASVSVTQGGCPNAVPPRTNGETWAMPNCSEATCAGNGVITVRARQCPKRQKPTCANGYPAVIVAHPEDCCPSYECKCVCSRWGKPHYVTFDGTYYTFLENCTYVLVQQIVPVFGHFRVLIDTYFCDAEDGLPCLQSIIIEYQQDRVVLTRKPVGGVMTNEIIFNGEVVRPGFRKDGIVVSQIGIKMYVTIPALGVQVMFSGLIFSVELPFSKFANNTEGQCGTCTNDQKDECRLPGGAVVPSCSDMPGHWNVTHPGQPSCSRPPLTPTTVEPKKTSTSCLPSPICQLILSKVFKPCHSVIPPWPYYQACAFDQCHAPTVDTRCSSLELYAALCASLSVCIDWRGLTAHECPFTCPADKVYRPCGPSNPSYCYMNNSANTLALPEAIPITEGCFCPEDMTLFSSSSEVCVPANCSSCVGPDGEPVEPGHTVSVGCQECTCKDGTWTLSCQTRPCAPPPACPEPGFVPVPAALQTGQCCPQYTCVCNTTHCPAPVDCPEGSRSILAYKEGACCPTQNCSRTVCSINGTLYQPGTIVSSNLCEKCWCELPGGPQSDTVVISCETQICSTHCPVGFEYQTQSGQCCGECVQVACVMNTSNSSAHLFYPGESWSDPGSRCVTHKCEKQQDGLVVVTTKKACAPLGCPADKARLSEDGCCLSCPHPPAQNRSTCAVYHELRVLRQRGCSSVGPVRLTYCQGNCGDTTSMYSLEARAVEHRCRCCRELRASVRSVTLRCGDGSSQAFNYTEVQECGCVGLRCDSHGGSSRSGEAQGAEHSQEAGLRRWSRGAPAPRPLQ
ncbi:mucin-5AC [Globicephala melas]|uniref:mucin-5AC n=1 Tax=Globicephala melas TaxID=9731 RepID=UPI00293D90EF|nr:mucin-5AC [Globicephala melas]